MTYALLILSIVASLRGLLKPAGYLLAPTLMALVFASWLAPQLLRISNIPVIPRDAIFDLAFMSCLCVVMAQAGWYFGIRRRMEKARIEPPKPRHRFTTKTLLPATIAITLVALVANIILNQMRADYEDIRQWYGPIVIVNVFAQLRIVSLSMSLILFLRERTPATITLAVINLLIALPFVLIYLRRGDMIDIAVIVGGALFFGKGLRIPIPAVLSGIAAVAIVTYAIEPLRVAQAKYQQQHGERVSLVSPVLWTDLDLTTTISRNADTAYDLRNASFVVLRAQDTGRYATVGGLWNAAIQLYVPGQIIGRENKEAMMVNLDLMDLSSLAGDYGYFSNIGTTVTGPASAYRDFWFFGSICFFFITYLMAFLYWKALHRGIFWQAAYLSLLSLTLISITHEWTKIFVNVPIYGGVIFMLYKLTIWWQRRLERHDGRRMVRARHYVPRPNIPVTQQKRQD